ncbi:unnamed protein product [Dibothriocephalus latus]|uniref:Serine-threonine/tyrosine-protein kinase catalytic domain-containing protein n=1 Tax=Dibothriocephalus latus TaxID=60516 RepID=A0A3P6VD86_DIBLA|nr:unnamed protein product [Dibothriocephalus latus]
MLTIRKCPERLILHLDDVEAIKVSMLPTEEGSIIHLKRTDVPETILKSKVMDHLRALRELQYENIHPFIGVYLESKSSYLVYEYCSRGSLQGMHFLQKSFVRVHGRLKSSNCVISVRWVLKITDFGVGKVQNCYRDFQPTDSEGE